ncbi:MAG: PQQ-binding-like beta-propeller repeat protein [Planctomycetaceae bacterium]|nr:PQQ-binding-like beta-propeller repeat protein [Planctomycetaceae bacterium]
MALVKVGYEMAVSVRLTALLLVIVHSSVVFGGGNLDLQSQSSGRLTQRWLSQAVMDAGREKVQWMLNDEDFIYVQSTGGTLTALNAENGRKVWARHVGQTNEVASGAATNSQVVVVVVGPVLYALDKFTGEELISFRLPLQPSGKPALKNHWCYLPMNDGSLYAYSLFDLQHLERFGELPSTSQRPHQWRFIVHERINFAAVAGERSIAFGSAKGSIHGLHPAGIAPGTTNFELMTRVPIAAPLTLVRRGDTEYCLAATEEGRIFCLLLSENGRQSWIHVMARPIADRMVGIGDDLFVPTQGDGMHVLSLSDGVPRQTEDGIWLNRDAEVLRAVTADTVYAVDAAQRLICINRQTGKTEARINLQDFTLGITNDLTDRVYLATTGGQVMCLAETGSDFAAYHQNPELRPIMPAVPAKDQAPETTPADQ